MRFNKGISVLPDFYFGKGFFIPLKRARFTKSSIGFVANFSQLFDNLNGKFAIHNGIEKNQQTMTHF